MGKSMIHASKTHVHIKPLSRAPRPAPNVQQKLDIPPTNSDFNQENFKHYHILK